LSGCLSRGLPGWLELPCPRLPLTHMRIHTEIQTLLYFLKWTAAKGGRSSHPPSALKTLNQITLLLCFWAQSQRGVRACVSQADTYSPNTANTNFGFSFSLLPLTHVHTHFYISLFVHTHTHTEIHSRALSVRRSTACVHGHVYVTVCVCVRPRACAGP